MWKTYAEMSGVLMVKYEDMMEDPIENIKKIERYLGLSVDPETREKILWKYSKDNPGGERTGMHFNKATTKRYETEMSDEQKVKCEEVLGSHLKEMNYGI